METNTRGSFDGIITYDTNRGARVMVFTDAPVAAVLLAPRTVYPIWKLADGTVTHMRADHRQITEIATEQQWTPASFK